MKIYCNTNKEETFVRFGKRFKHGKSINYLAMSPRIKDIYSERLAELQYGYITEEEFNAWCEDALDSFVWEPNISCFNCDPKTYLPIITNVSQTKTLIGFIRRFEADLPCQAFLVKGEQVGVGTDQEPLVNVTYEEPIEFKVEDLIQVAIKALKKGFEFTERSSDNYSDEFVHLSGPVYLYKDWLFMFPKSSYIKNFEYNGPVMDKFKFESLVDIDYDDIQAIFISADQNGGQEELEGMLVEWSDTIYEKPYYFENRYHIATDIKQNGDIYVCGSEDAIWDFTNDFPIEYKDIEPPADLVKKYLSMKFYE